MTAIEIQFIARPAGRSLTHTLATVLMYVETGNKFHCYEPWELNSVSPFWKSLRFIRRYCLNPTLRTLYVLIRVFLVSFH